MLVHGATGFTGRLVCEALKRRAVPFAIAGRSKERLDALARALGGDVETCVVDVRDAGSLRLALTDRAIVCACAGPFAEVGEPVLASCAKMGVHYVDTTGEQSFVLLADRRYRATAEASGACIAPAMAYEIAPADWAATEAARRAGGAPDAIDIVYMLRAPAGAQAISTRGTKKSALGMMASGDAKQFIDGALRDEAAAAVVKGFTSRSGRRVTAASFPSPEAVVVPSHTGASTVRTFMAMGRGAARSLHAIRGVAPGLVQLARPLLTRLVERGAEGPDADARKAEFDVLAEARRGADLTRVFVSGSDPYGLTAEIQALAAARALAGEIQARGVVAPSLVIPPDVAARELAITLSAPLTQ